MTTTTTRKLKTIDIVYIAIFAALMAVCSWISIPMVVPFTLQTLGVFLAVCILGGKRGTIAVLVYILLGAVGLPVFANFKGGPGALLGTTGGYIIGFLFTALVMWAMERIPWKKGFLRIVSMLAGLFVCYAFGTAWFMLVYARDTGAIGVGAALMMCVVPFLIPDVAKIVAAYVLSNRLRRFVQ